MWIAIAADVCDGLGFGDNSKAALITRAMAEVRRLGVACGAQTDTFFGLSGLGDFDRNVFFQTEPQPRFWRTARQGEKLADRSRQRRSHRCGSSYPTARSAAGGTAQKHKTITPVIDEVYLMLYEGKDYKQGVRDLMSRDLKAED